MQPGDCDCPIALSSCLTHTLAGHPVHLCAAQLSLAMGNFNVSEADSDPALGPASPFYTPSFLQAQLLAAYQRAAAQRSRLPAGVDMGAVVGQSPDPADTSGDLVGSGVVAMVYAALLRGC